MSPTTTVIDERLRALNDCGCCGAGDVARVRIRPGLSAIPYRSGTWSTFKRQLLAALAATRVRTSAGIASLAALTTRDDDDFTIALLDAVAATADVLTFYGERIVNESFLRTATERMSLLELAHLIGYELQPGVAASTPLVFTIEDARAPSDRPRVARLDAGVRVQSVPGPGEKPQTFETVEAIEARPEWNAMPVAATAPELFDIDTPDVWLQGAALDLKPGDAVLLVDPARDPLKGDERWDARVLAVIEPQPKADRTHVTFGSRLGSHQPTSAPAQTPDCYVLGIRAAVFGANAPDWKVMPSQFRTDYRTALALSGGGTAPADTGEWPRFTGIFNDPVTKSTTRTSLDLDAVYPGIVQGSWLVLAQPQYVELYQVRDVVTTARAEFTIASKVTRVTLEGENFDRFANRRRETSVYAQTRDVPIALAPIVPAATGTTGSLTFAVSVPDLEAGRTLYVSGIDTSTGRPAGEAVTVASVSNADPTRTRVQLRAPLRRSYRLSSNPDDDVASAMVYGNVAAATHGETVREVLGGGDASRPYQAFALKQAPLTFVRDTSAPSGARSTLRVRVNDLQWDEVPTFYERERSERVFATRRDDNGVTTVAFGDGIRGARVPTGAENVRVTYRKGLGLVGNVRAGQLTTLLSKPLGLKTARNPEDAVGGADPESRDRARENAPLTVRTLDRVVALRDYEDFARAYAGIAKALATWTWSGQRRMVCVTVAGPDGAPVADAVRALLAGAIVRTGDPFTAVRVVNFRPVPVTLAFNLKTAPAFDAATVTADALTALRDAYEFAARPFAEGLALSSVIGTIQRVRGVTAVDVTTLQRTLEGATVSGLSRPLPAASAELVGGQLRGAELLTLAPAPIAVGVLT